MDHHEEEIILDDYEDIYDDVTDGEKVYCAGVWISIRDI